MDYSFFRNVVYVHLPGWEGSNVRQTPACRALSYNEQGRGHDDFIVGCPGQTDFHPS